MFNRAGIHPNIYNEVEQLITEHFVYLKDLFTERACHSLFPALSMIDFAEMLEDCDLIDADLKRSDIDTIFIQTNYEGGEDIKNNV